jgi:hypothetical protein
MWAVKYGSLYHLKYGGGYRNEKKNIARETYQAWKSLTKLTLVLNATPLQIAF